MLAVAPVLFKGHTAPRAATPTSSDQHNHLPKLGAALVPVSQMKTLSLEAATHRGPHTGPLTEPGIDACKGKTEKRYLKT